MKGHTFREPENESFGLFENSPLWWAHDIWSYLTRQKTLTFTPLLANDFQDGTTQNFAGDGYNYQHRLRANEFNAQTIASVPVADYTFRGVARPVSSSGAEKWRAMRLVFRYSDNNNYYFVNIEPNDQRVQLFRRQQGVETSLADMPTPIHFGVDYDFEIRIHGSGAQTIIQVFWNTIQLLVVPGSIESTLTSGGVGMRNNGVTGELSDVLVTTLEQ